MMIRCPVCQLRCPINVGICNQDDWDHRLSRCLLQLDIELTGMDPSSASLTMSRQNPSMALRHGLYCLSDYISLIGMRQRSLKLMESTLVVRHRWNDIEPLIVRLEEIANEND